MDGINGLKHRRLWLQRASAVSLVWALTQWHGMAPALAHTVHAPHQTLPLVASRAVPPHARLHGIEPDARNAQRLYAATPHGLMRSSDGGRSWQPLLVAQTHAEVFTFAMHPTQPDHLFVGRADGVWRSRDGGQTWQSVVVPGSVPLALSIAASQPQTLYLGTARHGVMKSQDGGQHWHNVSHGLPEARAGRRTEEVHGLVVDPADSETVYVTIPRQGIYRTTDGGRHWRAFNAGLASAMARALAPPKLAFATGTSRLYLAFTELVHSHLLRTRLYVLTDHQEWLPVEVELPENFPLRGLVADRLKPMLQLWGPELVWEIPLADPSGSH